MNLGILVLSTSQSPLPQAKAWGESVELVVTEAEFARRLSDPEIKMNCALIGYKFLTPELTRVVKVLRLKRPLLPAFAQVGLESTVEPAMVQRLTLKGLLSSDTTLEEVSKQLQSTALAYQSLAPDSGNLDAIEQESKKTDEEVFPILLRDLLAGQRTYFDVYIRLTKNKYVKIINKGDFADLEQIKKYEKKNIKHFYLLREQQNKFLSYCDKVTESLVNAGGTGLAIKSQQVMQFGDQILKNFERDGVTSENLAYAREFLKRGLDNLKPISFKSQEAEQLIQSALADYDHSTAMCILGGMLTKSLGYTSLEKVNMISMAIMLHDLGLLELPFHLRVHSTLSLSDVDRSIFETHPRLGVEKILKTIEVPEIVSQAILCHHERRDRSGFPEQLSGSGLNFVAEVIGICDEYLAYLESQGSHSQFIKTLDAELKLKFSPTLIKAFKDVFQKKIRAH